MPPLRHKVGDKYDIMDSEVMDWIVAQPEVRQWLFDKISDKSGGKKPEFIKYNPEMKTWQGVDYGA